MTQEVLKLALPLLEDCVNSYRLKYERPAFDKAIAAIKEALAQPEQEPVALPCCGYTDASAVKWNPLNGVVQCHNCGQNYTTPQRTWVGLTNKEVFEICYSNYYRDSQLVKMVEAKLKQKNGYAEEKNT